MTKDEKVNTIAFFSLGKYAKNKKNNSIITFKENIHLLNIYDRLFQYFLISILFQFYAGKIPIFKQYKQWIIFNCEQLNKN